MKSKDCLDREHERLPADDMASDVHFVQPLPAKEKDQEVVTVVPSRKLPKKPINEDEPLIDTTQALPLRSKKTERLQKRNLKKLQRTKFPSSIKSFLELPPELLEEVFSHLLPSDLLSLLQINKSLNSYILANESAIVRNLTSIRYPVLSKCLPLPVPLAEVPDPAKRALLSEAWQSRLQIHFKPYQHIPRFDSESLCSCITCFLAWNNLNLVLDLAHFQRHFATRTPLPIIPRGTNPEWNQDLTAKHAAIVNRAIVSPLTYARLLQLHLSTITTTLLRPVYISSKKGSRPPSTPLYDITTEDVKAENDAFLERKGPSSLEFPYVRDMYHYIHAWVPNRGWSKQKEKWMYPGEETGKLHRQDIAWVVERFGTQGT
ncbi:unnamed protein product [Zymoseptoria tritici ST99CH_3D7]|uniref:F-box domain-containing protein n=1 Tax=Zymoseptoria tritici (strain ST99CH_3D7) TaxID=1276538 RepID=A0A1X7S5X9_ZYMT9|nr:unnamed protein product [Zymoseptoria tritici ST99CH_3D7]